jgi:radical SAM superfamily enzyme YgiQ (UPF0313 family)
MTTPGRRLLLIKPSAYDARGRVIRGSRTFFPSRTLPYLAALTPSGFEVRILDEAVQGVRGDEDADLVAFTGMLPNMPRAIDLARGFRARGIPTVIGGIGVFSLSEMLKASGCFDSVVHGEAETVWGTVLDDYRAGRLQASYTGGRCEDLSGLPVARFDLLDFSRYWRMPGERIPWLTVETSRGCPHHCAFCAIRLFFGQRMRFRPIGDVVAELRALGTRGVILTDDNLGADPERARELFLALKPLGIQWGGQFGVDIIRHPDVLRLAAESGCRFAGVGIESLVPDNLRDMHKVQGTRFEIEDVARSFREAGISMTASMIFGLDHDTPESLAASVDRLLSSGVDFVLPWVLCPGPGCELYDQLKQEGRLLHENYSLYNGMDVVFQPKHMSPAQLADCSLQALRRFYQWRHIGARVLRAPRKLDVLGLSLFFWNMSRRGLHPFSGVV